MKHINKLTSTTSLKKGKDYIGSILSTTILKRAKLEIFYKVSQLVLSSIMDIRCITASVMNIMMTTSITQLSKKLST